MFYFEMKKKYLKNLLFLSAIILLAKATLAQESEGKFLKDVQSNCTVWFKHTFSEDSVTWRGACKDNFATGQGTMFAYTKGKQTSTYIGEMKNGKPNGKGTFTFGSNRKLEGNFVDGEPLFLSELCLNHLHKNVVSEIDDSENYVGDNNLKQLYYHAIVPEAEIKGAIILMPGTWETTEHLLSSTKDICELAFKNNLVVLAFSINQRITLTDSIVSLMNSMIADAIQQYKIPKNKIVIGGWSMGGLFSLRYTELANQDASKTIIKPAAVFSCDGPSDLVNIYNLFQMKLKKYPNNDEAVYGMKELEKYCGGKPNEVLEKYHYFSSFTYLSDDGGNAQYLLNTPLRIYNDIDPIWWMHQRGLDMYYMNGLDQTAMIQFLNDKGNTKAEFINSYQKGYRIEGNRHPHSWSIVEPLNCINWILDILK